MKARIGSVLGLALGALVAAGGCGGGLGFQQPGQQGAVTITPEQQTSLTQQTQQYQQRVASLDSDNQELQAMLAQSKQQTQLLEEQISATQMQLKDTTDRLASLQADNEMLQDRTSAITVGMQSRGQAEIRANNSLLRSLSISNMPGIEVRQDGDVIRIEVPADQLFEHGQARLKPSAAGLLQSVAADLSQNYPQQMIGIEGHTDGRPATSQQFPTDQHLAVAQSMAVYEALSRAGGMRARQLFVVAHGGSQPVVSNGTEAGRARNRRIEIVVYPETVRR